MNRYITVCVAWPYANNNLHLGHIAGTISSDVLARYHRMAGDHVLMVGGTDSHGTKPSIRAKQEGVSPKDIVDRYDANFRESFNAFNYSYDLYSITYNPYHKAKVQEFTKKFYENGYLYENKVIRPYCATCGKFVADTEIEITCPNCGRRTKADSCDCGYVPSEKDLEGATCLVCSGKTTQKENKVLVFKLSAFKDALLKHMKQNENIWRQNSINETKKYLQDLQDRDYSRDLDWGIEIPIAGFEDKKIWVWWEALLGYVTDVMRLCEERKLNFDDYFKNSTGTEKRIYLCHAKDNIPFHSLFLPAMLLATKEDYFLPNIMVSSEYLTMNDAKISKSAGNGKSAIDYAKEYNTDSLRYYLIANGPEKRDSNFTIDLFKGVHNADVVNKFGNLINRVLKFKGLEVLPEGNINPELKKEVLNAYSESAKLIESLEFKKYAELVMELVASANRFYDEQKPWVQAKEDLTAFNNTIYSCAYVIANLSNLLEPIMPDACKKLRGFLNLSAEPEFKEIVPETNVKLDKVEPLFARM
ncbi:MAG: methionine--tRNA ligase [Clostridia bacterium]|nr:methionine--tRNA ligase [Clostridia bacterium]